MDVESDGDRWSDAAELHSDVEPQAGQDEAHDGWSPSASPVFSEASAEKSDSESWGCLSGIAGEQAEAANDPVPMAPAPEPVQPLVVRCKRGRPPKRPAEPNASAQALARSSAAAHGDLAIDGLVALGSSAASVADRSVSHGGLMRLRRWPRFDEPPPLASAVGHALQVACKQGAPQDPAVTAIAAAELADAVVPMMSGTVASQVRSVSIDIMNDRMELLAASAWQVQRSMQWLLELSLAKRVGGQRLLMYLDNTRYDETPMKVKTSGASASSFEALAVQRPLLPEVALQVPGSQEVAIWTPMLGEKVSTNSKANKILQIESSVGMLVEAGGRYFGILSSPAQSLAIVERTTAKCLHEALERGSFASWASGKFAMQCRSATTDKASENILCEKGIAASRSWGCAVHNPCDVHTLARVFGQVFNGFVSTDITGMIRFSLSLNVAAQMNAFRRALREEIGSRKIRILSGASGLEARRYRLIVLKTFAGHGRNIIAKRMLLSLLPNGDWRSPEIQVYMGNQAASVDEDSARKVVANGLITALAGTMFEQYPRHRWVGADIAVDRCTLLCLVHNLGRGAYARYMGNFGPGPSADKLAPDDGQEGLAPPLLAVEDGEAYAAGGGAEGAEGDGPGSMDPSLSRAAFNDASRRVAEAWWRQDPTLNLVITRLVMEPARELMSQYLKMAGSDWDAKQMRAILKAQEAGRPIAREFRVTIAASNILEAKCLDKVRLLIQCGPLWTCLPPSGLTVGTRCLVFRMLHRLACAVHELLIAPHRRFPTKLFLLLGVKGEQLEVLANDMLATPVCLLDTFTAEFFNKYRPSLTNDEPMAILEFVARTMKREIVQIEAKHASVRRWLMSRSLQTHTLSFKRLGVSWVLQRLRRSRTMWPFKRPPAEPVAQKATQATSM